MQQEGIPVKSQRPACQYMYGLHSEQYEQVHSGHMEKPLPPLVNREIDRLTD